MQKRVLGKTDLEFSLLGLGTWAIGGAGWGQYNEKESIKVFNGKTKYNEWEFVYVPRGPLTGGGIPQGQMQPGQGSLNQSGGGAMTPGVVTPVLKPPGAGPMQ